MTVFPHFGQSLQETELKKGLRELNPDIHFDMGANLNIWHPRIDEWQGIFHNGRHVSSMGRGLVPEFNVYKAVRLPDGRQARQMLLFVGWRTTFESLVRQNIDGVTWPALCKKFKIEYKQFIGHPSELEVA